MIIEESEYKGNPTICLKRDETERYPFSFGLTKAKMIIESIDKIREFVKKNDKEQGDKTD